MRPLVPVILSGGAGTRLWPLSREASSKPFLPLPDGGTLLGRTASRARALPGVGALATVTNREYYFATKDVYAAAGGAALPETYLLEPFGRNTAAAVALAALWTRERVGDDAPMLVLPADHLIRDEAAFARAVAAALSFAAEGMLVTFGIAPDRPETGYGYIECEAQPLRAGDVPAIASRASSRSRSSPSRTQYVASGRRTGWTSSASPPCRTLSRPAAKPVSPKP